MKRFAIVPVLLLAAVACSATESDSAGSASKGGNAVAQPVGQRADSGGATRAETLGREQIRTGAMTVRVDDVQAAARAAVRAAEDAGGFLEADQTVDDKTTMTLRVPPAEFTGTAETLGRLGTVTNRTVETKDVTNDVADVSGRLKAARASVARVRALLDRASTISEITSLERELNERESDLESLETRSRSLHGRTSLASLTVTFARAAAPPVKAASDPGFSGGLHAGWRVFTATVAILLVMLGALLPFLAVGAVFVAPYVYLRRRRVSARA
jgi:hypothetical protein